ncbi:MAG: ribosome small subunit-dependent GTPase A [Anaerovoracaceae bacterium]
MEGKIIRGVGGFYFIRPIDGGEEVPCRARGIFKKQGIIPMVGDWVEWSLLEDRTGVVEKIRPRSNWFIRPPIANVDTLLVVMSFHKPRYNLLILDRLLVMAEKGETDAKILMNKVDLATQEDIDSIRAIYENTYPCFLVNGLTGEGLEEIKASLKGSSAALVGPSGVGKSTLLNDLLPGASASVGEISTKTERGKHTTRHVEIFSIQEDTDLFDTPGFTSFDTVGEESRELASCYPEMIKWSSQCRFHNCQHLNEPGCKVREAMEEGWLPRSRYESYRQQMDELMTKERNKYS